MFPRNLEQAADERKFLDAIGREHELATNKSELMQFEFTDADAVVGRATWLGPGMVEFDFHDPQLRRRFSSWFDQRQEHLGAVFEEEAELTEFWRDETRSRFAEACWSMANYYKVRRTA